MWTVKCVSLKVLVLRALQVGSPRTWGRSWWVPQGDSDGHHDSEHWQSTLNKIRPRTKLQDKPEIFRVDIPLSDKTVQPALSSGVWITSNLHFSILSLGRLRAWLELSGSIAPTPRKPVCTGNEVTLAWLFVLSKPMLVPFFFRIFQNIF